jgi:nicotinic acid phosphoribosyltransferase
LIDTIVIRISFDVSAIGTMSHEYVVFEAKYESPALFQSPYHVACVDVGLDEFTDQRISSAFSYMYINGFVADAQPVIYARFHSVLYFPTTSASLRFVPLAY